MFTRVIFYVSLCGQRSRTFLFFRAHLQVNVFFSIEKDYERFLVKSKKKTIFDVNITLANLDFLVYTASEYICRQCHSLLKNKYRQLMRSTWRIETMVLPEQSQTMHIQHAKQSTDLRVNSYIWIMWCQNEQRRYIPKHRAWETKSSIKLMEET